MTLLCLTIPSSNQIPRRNQLKPYMNLIRYFKGLLNSISTYQLEKITTEDHNQGLDILTKSIVHNLKHAKTNNGREKYRLILLGVGSWSIRKAHSKPSI